MNHEVKKENKLIRILKKNFNNIFKIWKSGSNIQGHIANMEVTKKAKRVLLYSKNEKEEIVAGYCKIRFDKTGLWIRVMNLIQTPLNKKG